ncbi:gamma-glutamyltranspeptidase [Tilletiaria anomala UBC 951]|uniref:Gamma-glutamyltranspeptidase n=1 Tax=Tilletiaria anomala (strain ATCC 24038 / CBS 436.72 / UBC 951) TaxID=1037660 RepID=A0A066WDT2_TILAU|nr:gamma-glutamyltranspeptidase [Tilletiaria anomala UBC 951]KDN52112.1 gamma-glutamyltranspeptidase [Tilletiaria anomala UBC 951]
MAQRQPLKWDKVHPKHSEHFAAFPSRRSTVMGSRGMVACSQPLAASAGIAILEKGGNAADAAVAVAAALNVTEPCSTGIGGDAFCLFYDAKTKDIRALNGSGRTPKAMPLERLRESGVQGEQIPLTSPHAATVPGAASTWVDTVHLLGSGNVQLKDVLAPAIQLAENGVPVHEIVAEAWKVSEKTIKEASPNANEMLLHGKAPRAGEIMAMPNLARTFRELAEHGKDGFYKGRVAQAIVDVLKLRGGVMELEDLAAHAEIGTEEVEPIRYTYHHPGDKAGTEGVTVYECPPNGQGLTALLALGILDEMQNSGQVIDLTEVEHNSAEYLHALIEAFRLAFADTRWYVADPEHGDVPVQDLLSKQYLQKRAALFEPSKATVDVRKGSPVKTSDTVYFSVVDEDGNACSFINSNYVGFGTAIIPKGCGFTLQNRGAGFVLQEGHPNCFAPSKRPYHTIIPALALRGDQLFLSYGVMGGFMQPQGHVQVLLNILHRGFTPQAALDAPRFCIGAGMPDQTGSIDSHVYLEEGIKPEVVEKLRQMGHNVKLIQGWGRDIFGRGQVIQKLDDPTGKLVWAGGSDMRADGQVIAQL